MKSKILFVLCLLSGLMFINAGLNKFFNYMPMPESMPEDVMKMFTGMMAITWLMPLVGAAEVFGGILYIIPKTRPLGALVLLPIMVGIVLTHSFVDPSGLPMALALFAILVWVIVENREKYLPMVR